ncbi:hypothetical protein [Amycolatopsis panacis]|uniref:hypothetical protein n=1 Tax=Amycolatopsis panacis TaxID=2340917 RepID=UPI0013144E77|nr:hypothetical protein [Amycolatopsis panacis]
MSGGELTVVIRHSGALSDAGFTDEARSIARRAEELLTDAPPSWLVNLVKKQRE